MNTYTELISQIALTNKYTRWYLSIISKRKIDIVEDQCERHHIVPKSFLNELGQKDDLSNLVALTSKEHFVCHQLLTKMFTGGLKRKMCYAMHRLCFARTGEKLSSRKYDYFMRQHASNITGEGNPMFRRKHSAETRAIIASKALGRTASIATKLKMSEKHSAENNAMFGRNHSDSSRIKMRVSHAGKHGGENNAFFGKKHNDVTKKIIADSRRNAVKLTCVHCGKKADSANFTRWHGEKCKLNNTSTEMD